jgi:hypothetical protein
VEVDDEKYLPRGDIEGADGSELTSVEDSSDSSSDTLVASAAGKPNE